MLVTLNRYFLSVKIYDTMGLFVLQLRHTLLGLDMCKDSLLLWFCHADVISCIPNNIKSLVWRFYLSLLSNDMIIRCQMKINTGIE
jgi:hypothetical protein